jgi:acetyl-CoA acetyltransferase
VNEPTIRDKTAIVGIGETTWYRHGRAPLPEFVLALQAITRAAGDAGIDVREIDGFAGYAYDRNEPGRIANALGLPEVKFSNMHWGGGGGGGAAAIGNAAAAVAAGYANSVVVFRAIAQGQFRRLGQALSQDFANFPENPNTPGHSFAAPYGLFAPAHMFALRVRRFLYEHNVGPDAQAAIALAAYHHAQQNPHALTHGRPLNREQYDGSRWIVEPFRLYDCCQESDGAAAVIVTTSERAKALKQTPAYVMSCAQGSDKRYSAALHYDREYAAANQRKVAARLYAMAGIGPEDVDVVQSYDHFTGGVIMSLVEHGFCRPEEVNEFCTFENLSWPDGTLPLNTSGGNIAECYVHGFELITEAVRQVRGTSTCQVRDAEISLVASASMTNPTSSLILRR